MMEQRVTVRETDVNPGGGRVLHVYDTGPAEAGSAGARDARLPVDPAASVGAAEQPAAGLASPAAGQR